MEKSMFEYKFYWEPADDGGVRLLRVFGEQPYAVLPETIEGNIVTEIGAYCFAPSDRLPEHYHITKPVEESALHELSGSYLKALTLPDGVKKIGGFAFYNCNMLETLELGRNMTETGSDAFMNCRNFHRIKLRSGVREPSGIRLILNQISSDMQVTFGRKGTEAVLLFPEYYESYDEIAPAHLFGRNIEGEGFRARQCFKDGIVDLWQYDTIFPKACAEESVKTLCELSMNRICYPVDLAEEPERLYRDYIKKHAGDICRDDVKQKKLERIRFLCENQLADRSVLEESVRLAAQLEWAEGAAALLSFKENYFPRNLIKDRYSFDDL